MLGGPKKEMMDEVLAPVKNRNAFIADMIEVLQEADEDKTEIPIAKDSTLEDVQVDGDSASAKMVNGSTRSDIYFKKVDGSWRIDVTREMGL